MATTLRLSNTIIPQDIFDGGVSMLSETAESIALRDHALNIITTVFGVKPEDFEPDPSEAGIADFVAKATKVKSTFTDGADTQDLVKALIRSRYDADLIPHMIYDKPRLRIIPNSNYLNSGISYNYKAHRDTWYGGVQEQINHWMAVANVSPASTMYLTPAYFHRPVANTSEVFDLDMWDQKFRKLASQNVKAEERPHPIPIDNIPDEDHFYLDIPSATEVTFSGHHFHGSGLNTTNRVRFSVDYRTVIQLDGYTYPANIDNKCTGDLRKYMFPVA